MVNNKTMSESALRRKAKKLGYTLEKGYVRFTVGGEIFRYANGERDTGYMLKDNYTGFYEWGCYNELLTHQWSLQDVEDFLNSVDILSA